MKYLHRKSFSPVAEKRRVVIRREPDGSESIAGHARDATAARKLIARLMFQDTTAPRQPFRPAPSRARTRGPMTSAAIAAAALEERES